MKILHTADWHLGKRLEKYSRLPEQQDVLEEIIDLADTQQVDVVLIAGDLFDAYNPPTEAIDLFYRSLKRLSNHGQRLIVAIAGNHDSPDRIEAPDPLARELGILFAGYPNSQLREGKVNEHMEILKSEEGFIEVQLKRFSYPLRILLTPYANEFRLKTFLGIHDHQEELRNLLASHWNKLAETYCDSGGVNVLLAHLFVMKKGGVVPEEPEDEKPILHIGGAQAVYSENIPTKIQYAALGHLHRAHQVDESRLPIVYSGSPLSYSFSEAGQRKKVFVFDLKPGEEVKPKALELRKGKPLHRVRFNAFPDALHWLTENPHALVELTLVSDEYMTAEERKSLYDTHSGIVTLIPAVRNAKVLENEEPHLDLSLPIEELFKSYFKARHKQDPNEEIMQLFKEIRAEEKE